MITNWTFDITTFWHLCRARTFPASGYSQRKRPKIARLLAHLPAISNISYKNVNICALQWQASQRATWPLGRLAAWRANAIHNPEVQQSSSPAFSHGPQPQSKPKSFQAKRLPPSQLRTWKSHSPISWDFQQFLFYIYYFYISNCLGGDPSTTWAM